MLQKKCADCQAALSWKTAQLPTNRWPCSHCGKEHPRLETFSGLSNYQTGFFIERTIEKALKIKEERVAGEFIPFFDLLPKVFKMGNRVWRGLRVLSLFGD